MDIQNKLNELVKEFNEIHGCEPDVIMIPSDLTDKVDEYLSKNTWWNSLDPDPGVRFFRGIEIRVDSGAYKPYGRFFSDGDPKARHDYRCICGSKQPKGPSHAYWCTILKTY